MKRAIWSFLLLFASAGTLVCCALPALFVALGLGATLVSLLSSFPQLIWFSEHKSWVFSCAAILLLIAAWQWRLSLSNECPIDPAAASACRASKRISGIILAVSLLIFSTGAFFAFVLPYITSE